MSQIDKRVLSLAKRIEAEAVYIGDKPEDEIQKRYFIIKDGIFSEKSEFAACKIELEINSEFKENIRLNIIYSSYRDAKAKNYGIRIYKKKPSQIEEILGLK